MCYTLRNLGAKCNIMDNKNQNTFIIISAIVGIITATILFLQYKDQKKIREIELEIKKHQLDEIKNAER